jgi:AcrR family transcriptional regulator
MLQHQVSGFSVYAATVRTGVDEDGHGESLRQGLLGTVADRVHPHPLGGPASAHEGLRERKKRLMRQMISDTATGMFLERGFDEVRVAEVAAACDVSEKTVYNYFPTKESLLLDREESTSEAIERALGPGGAHLSPVDALVAMITDDVRHVCRHVEEDDWPDGLPMLRRFGELIENTPSLRAAQREMMDRFAEVAAAAMAARAGVDPEDPEPQIAAYALLGLVRVQLRAMHRYADGSFSPGEVCDLVVAEVHRAARLIDTGLWSFGMAVRGTSGRDQVADAAEAANEARRQVVAALRQARTAWHRRSVRGR